MDVLNSNLRAEQVGVQVPRDGKVEAATIPDFDTGQYAVPNGSDVHTEPPTSLLFWICENDGCGNTAAFGT
jgi:hypothetical protein